MKVVVTHGDVDGLISAVVFEDVIKPDLILFSAPYKLARTLGELSEKYKVKELYISDLACVDYASKSILKLFKLTGTKIYYFDHHKYGINVSDYVTELIFDLNKSCAKLVYEYYKVDNEHLSKLIEVAELSENFLSESKLKKESDILEFALSYNPDDDKFKLMLVKELQSKMPSEIEEVIKRSIKYNEKLNNTIKIMSKNVIYEDKEKLIINIGHAYVKDVKGCISKALSKIKNNKNKELVVAIFKPTLNEYVVTIRTKRNSKYKAGLIISNLIKEFGGKGGGHETAGSVSFKPEVIEKVIEKIKRW